MQKSMQLPKHKSEFPLYWKSMKKHKHFKFMGFLNILDEAEIHTIPRTWEKWISIIREKYGKKTNIPKWWVSQLFWAKQKSIVREKYGKTLTFQSNGFLKYFGRNRNPYNSQNMGKWIYIVREKKQKTQRFPIVFATWQI